MASPATTTRSPTPPLLVAAGRALPVRDTSPAVGSRGSCRRRERGESCDESGQDASRVRGSISKVAPRATSVRGGYRQSHDSGVAQDRAVSGGGDDSQLPKVPRKKKASRPSAGSSPAPTAPAPVRPAVPTPPFRGRFVEIPAEHAEAGYVDGIEYTPLTPLADDEKVAGLVVMLPGSGGGLGPGLLKHPQPIMNAPLRSAHGGLYMRLGHELSAGGIPYTWSYLPAEDTKASTPRQRPSSAGVSMNKRASSQQSMAPSAAAPGDARGGGGTGGGGGGGGAGRRPGAQVAGLSRGPVAGRRTSPRSPVLGRAIVCLQLDWSDIPRGRLRQLGCLESAVLDIEVGVSWLMAKYPCCPLVIVGFSFGGPSMFAATRRLPRGVPLAGCCSIAGSARGGPRFRKVGLDTVGAVRTLGRRRIDEGGATCRGRGRANSASMGDSGDDTDEESSSQGSEGQGGDWPRRDVGSPAILYIQGTHDSNVALQIAEYLYHRSADPKRFVRFNYAAHMLESVRDLAYEELRNWVIGALERWYRFQQPASPSCSRGFSPTGRAAVAVVDRSPSTTQRSDSVRRSNVSTPTGRARPPPVPPNQQGRSSTGPAEVAGVGGGGFRDGGSSSGVLDQFVVHGPSMSNNNAEEGQERWRMAPNSKRLAKCHKEDPEAGSGRSSKHPLAGLIGYSE
eukprot:TRINITY_DN37660_c0_g1_i1.p1 TRINITY_DN37660_c0_g1~~TRINITY_DN37660_c0_g1_i1.p1  ORF type:complete len:677 (-),score=117.46 TRINITY_DN37660_c0_g1_i1:79-2109(-)